MTTPLIIGHRGAAAELPENTLESFHLALNHYGADMIEFDVRFSKDEIPVVIHDATLERTTNGKGFVCRLNFEELQALDAGLRFKSRTSKKAPPMRIPSLEEVFTFFPAHRFAVEIKDRSAELVHAVMALVKKHGLEKKVVVGSKHEIISKTMREKYPSVPRFLSRNEFVGLFLNFQKNAAVPADPYAVASMPLSSCGFDFSDARFIQFLHNAKIKVFYWTVNDPAVMKSLAKKKADGIITDNPALARRAFA